MPPGIISYEAVRGISFELLQLFRAGVAARKNCFELSFYEGVGEERGADPSLHPLTYCFSELCEPY